jgi:hypothetical protein
MIELALSFFLRYLSFEIGKSSFINAIRSLKFGDPGLAATSCFGNTAQDATVYKFPRNKMITLHDLPSFGTTQFPTNEYAMLFFNSSTADFQFSSSCPNPI